MTVTNLTCADLQQRNYQVLLAYPWSKWWY